MFFVTNILLPIVIAALTYLLVDRLGEYKSRRNYCQLGVAIIEAMQEEVKNGVKIMSDALKMAEDTTVNSPPNSLLPNQTWNGMSTIPDEVLLRVLAISPNSVNESFPLRECRIHCKNYFTHMCQNYSDVLTQSIIFAQNKQNWRAPIVGLLSDTGGHYIEAATKVNQMLQSIKDLLEKNSKAFFPR